MLWVWGKNYNKSTTFLLQRFRLLDLAYYLVNYWERTPPVQLMGIAIMVGKFGAVSFIGIVLFVLCSV